MKCETMEDLQTYEQLASNATGVSYYDSELLVARNVDANVLNKGDKLRMKGLFVILCTNGNLTIEVNNEKICLNKNDLFFCHSMQVVANIVCSDDFRCDVLAFTIVRFSGMLNHVDGKIIQNIIFMQENPVMKLSEGDDWTYDYEKFVEFDAPVREAYKQARSKARSKVDHQKQRRIESRPPTVYKGTWRDAGKCEKVEY